MLRSLLLKETVRLNSRLSGFNQLRWMHSRNKKAMEFIAKGWSAMKEVDRVIDYCELNDKRLIPLLRGAKENFELALEADNSNTTARYWLSKLHLKYHVPGACKAVGAALLVEAAEMGNSDALYELGGRLRIENDYVQSSQQAFYYLEKAVEQLHPGALYLLGAVYLTGDCVRQDIGSAMWCFHRAAEKGHAAAAVAYGSLLLRGHKVPDSVTKFNLKAKQECKTKFCELQGELSRISKKAVPDSCKHRM
ncbi:Secretory immunoglobulin A-binding protein EsiB [Bienertia sinuspersici]